MIIKFDDLQHTRHAHEFVGADHGDVPVSLILVHSAPGAGPALHRHPYAEIFVVEGGHIVVGPPGVPHGFTNTGTRELRVTAIHCAPKFKTDWVNGTDKAWAS